MAVNLHFYSDLLCYWGWIGQHVNDQIRGNWSQEEVVWHYHCLPVYANIPERMAQTAPGDEGYLAFADKTENSLASFDGIDINRCLASGASTQLYYSPPDSEGGLRSRRPCSGSGTGARDPACIFRASPRCQ